MCNKAKGRALIYMQAYIVVLAVGGVISNGTEFCGLSPFEITCLSLGTIMYAYTHEKYRFSMSQDLDLHIAGLKWPSGVCNQKINCAVAQRLSQFLLFQELHSSITYCLWAQSKSVFDIYSCFRHQLVLNFSVNKDFQKQFMKCRSLIEGQTFFVIYFIN